MDSLKKQCFVLSQKGEWMIYPVLHSQSSLKVMLKPLFENHRSCVRLRTVYEGVMCRGFTRAVSQAPWSPAVRLWLLPRFEAGESKTEQWSSLPRVVHSLGHRTQQSLLPDFPSVLREIFWWCYSATGTEAGDSTETRVSAPDSLGRGRKGRKKGSVWKLERADMSPQLQGSTGTVHYVFVLLHRTLFSSWVNVDLKHL